MERSGSGRVIAVAGLKGGGGKTTLALGLLGALAEAGLRPALLDLDRAGAALAGSRRGPAGALRRAHPLPARSALPAWLAELAAVRAGADAVLLDLPPADPLPVAVAALTSDLVLLPAAATALELAAARATLAWLERARAGRPDGRPVILLVPSRIAGPPEEARGRLERIAALGLPLAPPLRLRDGHDRAYREGLPVACAAPGSPEHRELRAIAATVTAALGLARPASDPARGTGGAAPVRTGYLDEPPGARGPLDLSAYGRRLRDRLLPALFRRG